MLTIKTYNIEFNDSLIPTATVETLNDIERLSAGIPSGHNVDRFCCVAFVGNLAARFGMDDLHRNIDDFGSFQSKEEVAFCHGIADAIMDAE